jgi:hypothetical protein
MRNAGLALLLLAAPALAQEAPQPWPETLTNPKPLPDDLVLPLPCAGAIVFRPAATPAPDTPLADRAVRLGGTSEETGYADYLRSAYILGSLPGPDGARAYYIAKYEVTRDQWAAVMAEECPRPNMGGRRPQPGVSWFAAVEFTRRLTEWLLQSRPEALPDVGDTKAYLRLPSEVEWEYAARGGAAVSEAEFRERLFPMQGAISRYAWHQGAQSANNQLNPVGLLEPNPLGLYDVLGNVEELVLEPFRMNRVGREHGQVGGFVGKGGSFRDPAERLRTAMRNEYAYFDKRTGTATALDSFGLRPVLAAPVAVSLERVNELRAEWLAAQTARVELPEDPLAAVHDLAARQTEAELKARLEAIADLVGTERSRRNDVEDRAIRAALLNGALLLRTLWDDSRRVQQMQVAVDSAERQRNEELAAKYKEQLARAERRFGATIRGYTQSLFQIAEGYGPAQQRAQYDALVLELRQSGQEELLPHLERFKAELAGYVANPGLAEAELVRRAVAE